MRLLWRALVEEFLYWRHRAYKRLHHPSHRACRGYWDHA